MKTTGIVRRVDKLGRIVLPKELRVTMDIEENNGLEIYVEGEKICLKKYTPGCIFCGSTENLETYRDKKICQDCRDELQN